jgi:hypothetical protein
MEHGRSCGSRNETPAQQRCGRRKLRPPARVPQAPTRACRPESQRNRNLRPTRVAVCLDPDHQQHVCAYPAAAPVPKPTAQTRASQGMLRHRAGGAQTAPRNAAAAPAAQPRCPAPPTWGRAGRWDPASGRSPGRGGGRRGWIRTPVGRLVPRSTEPARVAGKDMGILTSIRLT